MSISRIAQDNLQHPAFCLVPLACSHLHSKFQKKDLMIIENSTKAITSFFLENRLQEEVATGPIKIGNQTV